MLSGPQGISIDAIYYWCDFSIFQFFIFFFWTNWLNETRVDGAGYTKMCSVESRPFLGRFRDHRHIIYLFTTYIFKLKVPFETWDKRAQLVRTDMLLWFTAWHGLVWFQLFNLWMEDIKMHQMWNEHWAESRQQRDLSRGVHVDDAQLVHLKMERKVACAWKVKLTAVYLHELCAWWLGCCFPNKMMSLPGWRCQSSLKNENLLKMY